MSEEKKEQTKYPEIGVFMSTDSIHYCYPHGTECREP